MNVIHKDLYVEVHTDTKPTYQLCSSFGITYSDDFKRTQSFKEWF